STLMSAHFCATIPNFRIMEIDVDDVPWKDDLVTEPPRIENGHLIVPTKPGWGADINEAAVRKHAPKRCPLNRSRAGRTASRSIRETGDGQAELVLRRCIQKSA